jgi:hypothetical protein
MSEGSMPSLDITKDVVGAMNKKGARVKMDTPKGF